MGVKPSAHIRQALCVELHTRPARRVSWKKAHASLMSQATLGIGVAPSHASSNNRLGQYMNCVHVPGSKDIFQDKGQYKIHVFSFCVCVCMFKGPHACVYVVLFLRCCFICLFVLRQAFSLAWSLPRKPDQ